MVTNNVWVQGWECRDPISHGESAVFIWTPDRESGMQIAGLINSQYIEYTLLTEVDTLYGI